jgi:hypothetical protein
LQFGGKPPKRPTGRARAESSGKSFITGGRADLLKERNARFNAMERRAEREAWRHEQAEGAADKAAASVQPTLSRWLVVSLTGGSLALLALGVLLIVRRRWRKT